MLAKAVFPYFLHNSSIFMVYIHDIQIGYANLGIKQFKEIIMKMFNVKKAIVVAACLFLIPAVGFAAQKATSTTHKKASVVACEGKKVGDAVTLTMKGNPVQAVCQEVNGVLKAVITVKK